jgi:hypothetical protein
MPRRVTLALRWPSSARLATSPAPHPRGGARRRRAAQCAVLSTFSLSLSLSLPVTRMMEVETGHGGVAGTPVCVVRVREQLDRGACWNAGVRSMDASPSRLALPADLTGIIPPPCG